MQVDCPYCRGIGSRSDLNNGDLEKVPCGGCDGTGKVQESSIERIWWGGNHITRIVGASEARENQ